jgi:hypothetical protein
LVVTTQENRVLADHLFRRRRFQYTAISITSFASLGHDAVDVAGDNSWIRPSNANESRKIEIDTRSMTSVGKRDKESLWKGITVLGQHEASPYVTHQTTTVRRRHYEHSSICP